MYGDGCFNKCNKSGNNSRPKSSVAMLDRQLIVSEDEDCSENNPSPLNYYDLAIQNDYSLAEAIVEQIALGMLSN